MWRTLKSALDGGILALQYGNTFGNGFALEIEGDGEIMPYLPNYPQKTMTVVRADDPKSVVDYGSTVR